jgi:TRAP-type mannitol/chloroaromatic compound transport system permease small subunit
MIFWSIFTYFLVGFGIYTVHLIGMCRLKPDNVQNVNILTNANKNWIRILVMCLFIWPLMVYLWIFHWDYIKGSLERIRRGEK